jgi:uncharacterized protein
MGGKPLRIMRAFLLLIFSTAELAQAAQSHVSSGMSGSSKTVSELRRSCDQGEGLDCWFLAGRYEDGKGVREDPKAVASFLERGCDAGHATACYDIAVAHIDGYGVNSDVPRAARLAERSCKGGAPAGCALLGRVYEFGIGNYTKDTARAAQFYKQACDETYGRTYDRHGCDELTKLTGQSYMPADPRAAQSAASRPQVSTASIANAAVNAGNAAYVRKDYATAAAQFASACDNGSASACGVLGEMFLSGRGVSPSGAKAAGPLASACDGGIVAACGKLGILFDSGNGVNVNKKRAFDLFNGACSRSDIGSCYRLGRLYEAGQGTGANVAQAAALYQKACTAGIADACSSVGAMYEKGVHFARSDDQSLAFYELACAKGSKTGCQNVQNIAEIKSKASELAQATRVKEEEKKQIRSGALLTDVSCLVYDSRVMAQPKYKTFYNSSKDPGTEVLISRGSETIYYKNSCSRRISYRCTSFATVLFSSLFGGTDDSSNVVSVDPGETTTFSPKFLEEEILKGACRKS